MEVPACVGGETGAFGVLRLGRSPSFSMTAVFGLMQMHNSCGSVACTAELSSDEADDSEGDVDDVDDDGYQ